MNLEDLAPRRAHFKMKLNGRNTRLFLRPFTLRDLAYLKEHWDEQELILKILEQDIEVICQIVWYMMEAPSKKKFFDIPIVFKDVDDNGQEFEVKPEGYMRFLALADSKAINAALTAFYESRGLNDAIVKGELKKSAPVKKK